MNICIAGWYFRPQFLLAVERSGYEALVIKHREGDQCWLTAKSYPNLGLEFGAYRQYVENHWDGVSDVFFCHDDAEVSDVSAFSDIAQLAERGVDQAYIFHDENEELVNGGVHGRGIWIRGDIIAKLKDDFPADMDNGGVNVGVVAQEGILRFHKRIMALGQNTGVIAIVPQIRFAHRGRLHTEMFVYRKAGPVPGGLVNVA